MWSRSNATGILFTHTGGTNWQAGKMAGIRIIIHRATLLASSLEIILEIVTRVHTKAKQCILIKTCYSCRYSTQPLQASSLPHSLFSSMTCAEMLQLQSYRTPLFTHARRNGEMPELLTRLFSWPPTYKTLYTLLSAIVFQSPY